jgi:membrane-associated protease RseP (regulator of RpoE activity)
MMPAEAEIESLKAAVARHFPVQGVLVTPIALTFQVATPPAGLDPAFDGLRQELVPKDYIPTITRERGEVLVHVQRRPPARFAKTQVNLVLLFLTILTTVFFGGAWNWSGYAGVPFLSAEAIGYGTLFFTLPLLTILGSHEMGHYLVAKRYKVHASLPFFLPSLPPLGTFGAFISMRDPIPNRRALLDIGISGPLVGFAIAIPVALAGLALSTAAPVAPTGLPGEAIQPSVLFSFLSLFFPLPDAFLLHPLAFAGWVGLFVTAINLLPAGQLDGGHVARALLGRNQFYLSWAAILGLFALSYVYPGWFIFGFLILMLGVRHPPPLNDLTPLDVPRRLVGVAAVVILLVTFVPQPFVSIEGERNLVVEDLAGMRISELNATVALGGTALLSFAVNTTGPSRETIVVTLDPRNLDRFGFSLAIRDVTVDETTISVNNLTVSFSLNETQRALVNVTIVAPASQPPSADVEFAMVVATVDGDLRREVPVFVRVT